MLACLTKYLNRQVPMIDHTLLILGFGGHARAVADVALSLGYSKLVFFDAHARVGEMFLEHPVVNVVPDGSWVCMPASGRSEIRSQQLADAEKRGWEVATLVSPSATIGAGAVIGRGSLVAHHAHVGPMAAVGDGCIINTGAVVEHECRVGRYSHISVNATVAGRVHIGENVFVGAGAVVIDQLSVCDNVTVGAGGVVVRDILQDGTYIGTPAKRYCAG